MNISKFKKLNTVVESLGYADSENYFEYRYIYNDDKLDSHWKKVLSIVNPDSVYMVDNEPFILFFSDNRTIDFKAIWNAQIPFVFVLKEDTIYIYNGKKLIKSNKNLEELERKTIKDIDKITFSYWNLNDERFLNEYKKELTGNQLNDSLLKNIQTLTNKLKNDFNISFATKLVLRIIFIRYLIDRGVNIGFKNLDSNNIEQSKSDFLEILKNKEELYNLFKYLDKRFDGNLFELNDEESSLLLIPEVFEMLSDFVSGGINLDDGQISLFPMYDFNIITVELISNIYEILLGDEGQQKNQSFYTPSYLVDYIISKTVVEKLKLDNDCRVLDPSCGSGIFLVKTYRKIIEKQIENKKELLIDDILIDELEANIFGIDLSREAIDVSVFSLYLTILDYKNPKDLVNFRLPKLVGKNLFVLNFFDERVKNRIQNIDFNFILGNPPWGKITGETDEISKEFIFELSNYLSSETICSLVLPSKLLYNHGNSYKKLREYLLTENHLIEVLELSPVRKEIFKNANAPAIILTYTKSDMNQDHALENKFTHISLKPNVYFELFDILAIEKNDVKFIEQKLLYKNDWAWKVLLYGTSWDLEICSRVKREYPTIGDTIKSINENRQEDEIIEGTGIQKGIGTEATSFLGKKLLDSRTGVDQFVVNLENSTPFGFKEVHRLRNPQIFEAPYCLIKKGINTKTFELKSAYSEDDFVFQETIRAIKGTEEDKNFLKAITGIFNSSLSSYMNVILGTSVGIEREQVFFNEVKNYPFFNNNEYIFEVAKLVDEIQNMKIKNEVDSYGYEIKELKRNLNNLVLKGFDLEGNSFVDYVIDIQIPMIRKDKHQLGNKTVTRTELEHYANEFLAYFIKTYSHYGYGIVINISTNLANQFVAFELNIVENSEKNIISFVDNKMSDKEMISRFSIKRQTDSFFSIRDSIVFEDTSFYILKKDLFKNWHPAVAKRDLAEVIERIMNDEEGVN